MEDALYLACNIGEFVIECAWMFDWKYKLGSIVFTALNVFLAIYAGWVYFAGLFVMAGCSVPVFAFRAAYKAHVREKAELKNGNVRPERQ